MRQGTASALSYCTGGRHKRKIARVKHMTHSLVAQAVFDEAGDTGRQKYSSRYLVVAGVVCNDLIALRRIVAQVRKRLDKRTRDLPEIKAARLAPKSPKIISQVLARLMALDVELYAAVLDKQAATVPASSEDWYRLLYAECVKQALVNHVGLWVLMDRRYTNVSLQEELAAAIESVQRPNTTLTLIAADSRAEPALQVADVVAWGVFQKYEHGDDGFYQVMRPKIMSEAVY